MKNEVRSRQFGPQQLADIHGIYRHWGHPTVDQSTGCQKVKRIAKRRKIPSHSAMKTAKAMFCRHFTISFISLHSRYPRLDTSKLPHDSALKRAVELNITTR